MASVRIGDVIAEKYRVEKLLGKGGMGHVYAARHIPLGQLVAIKILTATATGGDSRSNQTSPLAEDEARGRFRREAKAVVRLTSEHVARIYDAGVNDEDEPYIVMEHLDGSDLAAVVRRDGKLPAAEAVEYVMQACEGLADAHALGIVHRDVKPANLFLTQSTTGAPLVKVLDFGISKADAMPGGFDMTQTSAMLGSPKYMSPEQMHDPRSVDARTDVWSLGVVLYRLVCGVSPFEGDTVGRLCTMVLHEAPDSMRTHVFDIPPALEAVVMRCLEKDRSRRLANVAELASALVPFAPDTTRAMQRAERIAGVLGVPTPPTVLTPLPPRQPSMGPWASSQSTASKRPDTTSSRTGRIALVAAIAIATGLAAFVVAVRWPLRSTPPSPAVAVVEEPPATVTVAGEPAPTPPVGKVIGASAPAVEPDATTKADPPPPASARRPSHGGSRPRGAQPIAPTSTPFGIPDDRK